MKIRYICHSRYKAYRYGDCDYGGVCRLEALILVKEGK